MKLKKMTAAAAGTLLLLLALSPAATAIQSLFGNGSTITVLSDTDAVLSDTDPAKSDTDPVKPNPIDDLLGDVSGDGEVTAEDARLCLRCAVGLENYAKGSDQFNACDVDGDNAVTAGDARLILRMAVGLSIYE